MATTAYGCLLPQLDQKFEKEKEKTIASQEFSYFTDIYIYIYIRNTPINDAWMGIGAISIQHPKKGMVNIHACMIVLKEE